jgi:hypothetical protein
LVENYNYAHTSNNGSHSLSAWNIGHMGSFILSRGKGASRIWSNYEWHPKFVNREGHEGPDSFTLFLAVYLFAEGVLEFVISFRLRPMQGSTWLLFDGIITVILGILIWRAWPSSTEWVIGTLVGSACFSAAFLVSYCLWARGACWLSSRSRKQPEYPRGCLGGSSCPSKRGETTEWER